MGCTVSTNDKCKVHVSHLSFSTSHIMFLKLPATIDCCWYQSFQNCIYECSRDPRLNFGGVYNFYNAFDNVEMSVIMSTKARSQSHVFFCIYTYLVSHITPLTFLDLSVLIYKCTALPDPCFTLGGHWVVSSFMLKFVAEKTKLVFSHMFNCSPLPSWTKPPRHFQEFDQTLC